MNPLVASFNQGSAQVFLQFMNGGAERGLGDMAGLGGMAEVPGAGYGAEVFQLFQSGMNRSGKNLSIWR